MGQSPPRIRKRLDLPVPLPPTMRRWFCGARLGKAYEREEDDVPQA